MRTLALGLLLAIGAAHAAPPASAVGDALERYRDGRGRGRGLDSCSSRGGVGCGVAAVDAGSTDLNGYSISLALQCAGTDVYTESPRQAVVLSRASDAYCTKSDGTVVLLDDNQPRRERVGLRIEAASANSVTDPRDCSGVSWTKASATCAKTATGADGVANSASTVTATGANGTAVTTVTVASAKRSTSMYLKRRTGTGAVTVTRDNFGAGTDVSALLSTTTWMRVQGLCGAYGTGSNGNDSLFYRLDNCIPVAALTATAANPTIGIKLATSGDAVDIDFVQDEAQEFATSPMAGFSRAVETPTIASTAGLPVAAGELSVDLSLLWTPGLADLGNSSPVDTTATATACGVLLNINRNSGTQTLYTYKGGVGLSSVASITGYPTATANARNYRAIWGSGTLSLWIDGVRFATGAASMPDCHTSYSVASAGVNTNMLNGWLTRMKWTASAAGLGSTRLVYIVGDSIAEAQNGLVTNTPQQILSGLNGGRQAGHYVHNKATSGYTIAQCKTRWDADVANSVAHGTTGITTMVLQCGYNSAADGAPAVWTQAETMLNSAVAAGITVVPATITPVFAQKAFIDAFNTSMLAWCVSNGVTCANTNAALESSAGSGVLAAAYDYGDGVHLKQAGATKEATVWYDSNPGAF